MGSEMCIRDRGKINGNVNPNNVIIVAAHYDTWSPVPAISFGAREAVSVAVLMELARLFKEIRPANSIWFVALAGYWQALAGSREFVEKYYFSPEVQSGEVKPWVFIDLGFLDLETKGLSVLPGVGRMYRGVSYYAQSDGAPYRGIALRYEDIVRKISNYISQEPLREFLMSANIDPNSFIYIPPSSSPYHSEMLPLSLDSEPAMIAGCYSFSFGSPFSFKLWRGGLLNDLHEVNASLLRYKIDVIAYIISSFANDEFQDWSWEPVSYTHLTLPTN